MAGSGPAGDRPLEGVNALRTPGLGRLGRWPACAMLNLRPELVCAARLEVECPALSLLSLLLRHHL